MNNIILNIKDNLTVIKMVVKNLDRLVEMSKNVKN